MSLRPTPDPEVVPLLRAIKARIEGLGAVTSGPKDGSDVYYRNKTAFLQLEIRRDHMSLDLWLTGAQLEEARASGIARAHPFLGDEAVKVRFERAEDLSRIARWIEASYAYAPDRGKKSTRKKTVVKTTPLVKAMPSGPANGSPAVGAVERPSTERPAAKAVRAKKAPPQRKKAARPKKKAVRAKAASKGRSKPARRRK